MKIHFIDVEMPCECKGDLQYGIRIVAGKASYHAFICVGCNARAEIPVENVESTFDFKK